MLAKDKGEGNFTAHIKLTQLRIQSNTEEQHINLFITPWTPSILII